MDKVELDVEPFRNLLNTGDFNLVSRYRMCFVLVVHANHRVHL